MVTIPIPGAGVAPPGELVLRAATAAYLLEGVVRAGEFRDDQWRDGQVFSRLPDDPAPLV